MKKLLMTLLFVAVTASAYAMQASYYSVESLTREGQWKISQGRMANGKLFNENALTCAAGKQYKLGETLRITNIENGKTLNVVVTDRIARRFYQTRIDLSKKAFEILGGEQGFKKGLLNIKVEVVNGSQI